MTSSIDFTLPLAFVVISSFLLVLMTYLSNDHRLNLIGVLISACMCWVTFFQIWFMGVYVDEMGLTGDSKDLFLGLVVLISFFITLIQYIKKKHPIK